MSEASRHLDEFQSWFQAQGFKNVNFEVKNSEPDPYYETEVIYELVFSPRGEGQLTFEVWIGKEGELGFGIHRNSLLGARLAPWTSPRAFVRGQEPGFQEMELILQILEFVAKGFVGIRTTAIPPFGVVDAIAVISKERFDRLKSLGLMNGSQIFSTRSKAFPFQENLVFEAWS